MHDNPTPPNQFLNSPAFRQLFQGVETHAKLLQKVKDGLPGALARHCLYCLAREDGGLVIFSDSQAFASQLRFYAPTILARLNANQETPFKLVLIKNLTPTAPPPATRPIKPPSADLIKLVKASSQSALNDELGQALAKLGAAMERYAKEKA